METKAARDQQGRCSTKEGDGAGRHTHTPDKHTHTLGNIDGESCSCQRLKADGGKRSRRGGERHRQEVILETLMRKKTA